MKLKPLHIALAVGALVLLSGGLATQATAGGSGGSASSAGTSPAEAARQASTSTRAQRKQAVMDMAAQAGVQSGSLGFVVMHGTHIEADTIYGGAPAKSAAAQEYNLRQTYGPSIELEATANPLETIVHEVGGGTHIAARRPSNDTERDAARKANLKDLINRGAYSDAKARELTEKYGL